MVDTGPLVAAALIDDPDHEACVACFRAVQGPLVVPDLVIPEVCYLLARGAQARVEGDIERTAELVETYADLGLGTVDASVIAVAEAR